MPIDSDTFTWALHRTVFVGAFLLAFAGPRVVYELSEWILRRWRAGR